MKNKKKQKQKKSINQFNSLYKRDFYADQVILDCGSSTLEFVSQHELYQFIHISVLGAGQLCFHIE